MLSLEPGTFCFFLMIEPSLFQNDNLPPIVSESTSRSLVNHALLLIFIVVVMTLFTGLFWINRAWIVRHLQGVADPSFQTIAFSEIQVGLKPDGAKHPTIRLQFQIQVPFSVSPHSIQVLEPIIRDRLFTFLQEYSRRQIEEQGWDQLRQEILHRMAPILHPIPIHQLTFKELLLQ